MVTLINVTHVPQSSRYALSFHLFSIADGTHILCYNAPAQHYALYRRRNGLRICVNWELKADETFEARWHLSVESRRQWQQGTGAPLVPLVLFHAAIAYVGAILQQGHSTEKKDDGGDEKGAEHGHPLGPLEHIGGDQEDPPPQRDLPKVVGVPRVLPQPNVAPVPGIGRVLPVGVLLGICHGLTKEANDKHNGAGHVEPGHGGIRQGLSLARGVDEDDGKADSVHPHCLKSPKDGEADNILANFLKPFISTNFDNAKKEEG